MFAECSDKEKEENDWVKLWREMNDGMYWAQKGCKPAKDNFSIIGIQIAGTEMCLNVLIRDMDEIHHLYNLCTVEIPIQETDGNTVRPFHNHQVCCTSKWLLYRGVTIIIKPL